MDWEAKTTGSLLQNMAGYGQDDNNNNNNNLQWPIHPQQFPGIASFQKKNSKQPPQRELYILGRGGGVYYFGLLEILSGRGGGIYK